MLLEAWWMLAVSRAALWLLPWRAVASTVDRLAWPGASSTPTERLASAVRTASHVVPRATCLAQALALHAMLGRRSRPSTLRLGVKRSPGFEAHAWLECDGLVVIGEHQQRDHQPLE